MTRIVSFKRKRSYFIRSERQHRFMHSPWAAGVVLIMFTVVALILANLEFTKHIYHQILQSDFTIGFDHFNITKNVEQWVNDGLMVIFFFYIGLEIKREVMGGQLSSMKKAALPIAGAIGGMLVPALIYALFNAGGTCESGWGIPMATDIAFALGILSLMGNRVPVSLKVFLAALAIVDDLGAILVIALFYSAEINFVLLGIAALVVVYLMLLNRLNVYKMRYYLIPSVVLWVLFLNSGVHATISGVLIAITIPSTPRFSKKYFMYKMRYYMSEFRHYDKEGVEVLSNPHQLRTLVTMRRIAANAISPSQHLEYSLHHVVAFFIMPVFALANAGIDLTLSDFGVLSDPQGMGIFLGLVLGKPLGICLMALLFVKLGWGQLPAGANWKSLIGVGILGGIGFTMSIFIDNLAFLDPELVNTGKVAILVASFVAAFIGIIYMNTFLPKKPAEEF